MADLLTLMSQDEPLLDEWRYAPSDAAVFELLCQCGQAAVNDCRLRSIRALGEKLTDQQWKIVYSSAVAQGMAQLVYTHVAAAGLIPLIPQTIVALFSNAYSSTVVANRRLLSEQTKILEALTKRGVRALVLKGLPLAARYYRDWTLRPARDIDLLVERSALSEVRQTLLNLDHQPYPGLGAPRGFYALESGALAYKSRSGQTVEAHWRLPNRPIYQSAFPLEDIWRRAEIVSSPYGFVLTLCPADNLRYLSVHCAAEHGLARLIWLVDIAELARSLPDDWDWTNFARDTVQCGVALPVAVALSRAGKLLGQRTLTECVVALRDAAMSASEQAAWRHARAPLFTADWIEGHIGAPQDALDWAVFLRGVLFPSPTTLAAHYHSSLTHRGFLLRMYLGHWRQMISALTASAVSKAASKRAKRVRSSTARRLEI